MPAATLTTKGQLVVPKAIREHMSLHAGDRLDFVIKGDGEVVIRPMELDVRELKGMLRKPGRRPVSLEEMGEAVRKRAANLS